MLKKVLSLLAVCSMLFGLCAITAFAAPNANTTPIPVTATDRNVNIGKAFILVNEGTTSPAETFYLIQVDKDIAHNKTLEDAFALDPDAIPDLVQLNDASYTGEYPGTGYLVGERFFDEGDATTGAGTRKEIVIGLPEYTAVGVYTYTLKEDAPVKTAGVTYFEGDIVLVVTVETDGTGHFYTAAVHCEAVVDVNDAGGTKSDKFDNYYRANSVDPATGGLRIGKNVTGNLGDREKYFDFTIIFTAETGMNYATAPTVTVSPTTHTGNPTSLDFTDLDASDPDKATKTVTFKLKHGETIAFGNIPYGVEYAYEEADYSSEEYVTTYPQKATGATDPESGEALTEDYKSDVVQEVSKSYTVTNDKTTPVDTGVIVDSLPYVMVLAMVMLGGAMFLVSKKRRIAEDRA